MGRNVSGWAVGDRVVSMPYAVVCGTCQFCQAGEYGLCSSRLSYGSGVNGGFAEYLAVKASRIFRLPDSLETTAAALIEPLACSVKAVYDVAVLQPGETAIVIGPGPVGLLTLQAACHSRSACDFGWLKCECRASFIRKGFGCRRNCLADEPDSSAYKRITGSGGVDVVFECSGASAALRMAFDSCKKKGRVIQ